MTDLPDPDELDPKELKIGPPAEVDLTVAELITAHLAAKEIIKRLWRAEPGDRDEISDLALATIGVLDRYMMHLAGIEEMEPGDNE